MAAPPSPRNEALAEMFADEPFGASAEFGAGPAAAAAGAAAMAAAGTRLGGGAARAGRVGSAGVRGRCSRRHRRGRPAGADVVPGRAASVDVATATRPGPPDPPRGELAAMTRAIVIGPIADDDGLVARYRLAPRRPG